MIGVYLVRDFFLVVLSCVVIKFAVIGMSSVNEGAKTGGDNTKAGTGITINGSIRKMYTAFFIPQDTFVNSSPPSPFSTSTLLTTKLLLNSNKNIHMSRQIFQCNTTRIL